MAKKARTPAPPRKVQAPQRRDTRRTDRRTAAGRDYSLVKWAVVAGALALAAVAGILFYVARDDDAGKASPGVTTGAGATGGTNPFNKLPGVRKAKAPWAPEYASLSDRLKPLGLSALAAEELAYHIHQHLDVFIDGKPLPGGVPSNIGVNANTYITELHTHAPDAIIHVESATQKDYTLGAFFGEWGVYFDRNCLGAYCGGVKVYVNGKQVEGDPWDLVLKAHQQISVVVGKPPKEIPKSYAFGPGE